MRYRSIRRGSYACSLLLVCLSLFPSNLLGGDSKTQTTPKATSRPRQGRPFATNPLPGNRAIVSIAREGSIVKAGDVVCELDTSDLRDELERARIEVKAIEADAKTSRLSAEVAELAIEEQKAELSSRREALKQALTVAEAELELAQATDATRLKAAETKVKALKSAQQDLVAEAPPEKVKPLVGSIEESNATESEVEKSLEAGRTRVQALADQIALGKIVAPNAGRVVHARWHARSASTDGFAVLERGVVVTESQPLIRVDPARAPASKQAGTRRKVRRPGLPRASHPRDGILSPR